MLLIQCVNAYMACSELMKQEWDYKTAHAFVMLKHKLQPHVDFFAQKEMALAKEYGLKDQKGSVLLNERGGFAFEDPLRQAEYLKDRAELGAVSVDDIEKPISVPEPKTIKPVLLEALQGFIIFGEAEQ